MSPRKASGTRRCEPCKKDVHARGFGGHLMSKEHQANVAKMTKRPVGKVASITNIEEWKSGFAEGYEKGRQLLAS